MMQKLKKIISYLFFPYDFILLLFFFQYLVCQKIFGFKGNFLILKDLDLFYKHCWWFVICSACIVFYKLYKKRTVTIKTIFHKIYEFLHCIICLHLFFGLFLNLKMAIPVMNPYLFDNQFYFIDTLLHLNINPVEQLVALFKYTPSLVTLIDKIYISWFFVLIVTLVFIIVNFTRKEINIFLFSYLLLWVIGGEYGSFISFRRPYIL